MSDHIFKLDNPVWFALTETHSHLSVPLDNLRFYRSDHCTFGAIYDENKPYSGFEVYSQTTENFYIVGKKPILSKEFELIQDVKCDQMVFDRYPEERLVPEKEIIKLDTFQYDELIILINLVMPGYFRERTPEMGTFYGIYEEGRLVAAAGTRIQMNEYTEVSSVVTHPEHMRKNYALMLTNHCVDAIIKMGKIPYLHVLETNDGAIALYKKAGFEYRRKIVFWKIGLKD